MSKLARDQSHVTTNDVGFFGLPTTSLRRLHRPDRASSVLRVRCDLRLTVVDREQRLRLRGA